MIVEFVQLCELALKSTLLRADHSRWLTRAMRNGSRLPRIPTRLVRHGGFDGEMSTREGRERAEEWWREVLSREDLS